MISSLKLASLFKSIFYFNSSQLSDEEELSAAPKKSSKKTAKKVGKFAKMCTIEFVSIWIWDVTAYDIFFERNKLHSLKCPQRPFLPMFMCVLKLLTFLLSSQKGPFSANKKSACEMILKKSMSSFKTLNNLSMYLFINVFTDLFENEIEMHARTYFN